MYTLVAEFCLLEVHVNAKAPISVSGPGFGPIICHWPASLGSPIVTYLTVQLHVPTRLLSLAPAALYTPLEILYSHRRVHQQQEQLQQRIGSHLTLSPVISLYHQVPYVWTLACLSPLFNPSLYYHGIAHCTCSKNQQPWYCTLIVRTSTAISVSAVDS